MLTPEQKASYEQIRQTALAELEALDREIASELSLVKRRLLELQESKKAVKQILDGASIMLGTSAPALREISLSDLNRHVELAKPAPAPSSSTLHPIISSSS